MPLAIELAAARTRLLDPSTLLDRLVAQVRELNGGDLDDDMAMLALGFPDLAER